jgi:magnesium-dependent phosphatase 1
MLLLTTGELVVSGWHWFNFWLLLQVVGCKSGREVIRLFDGALHALRQIHRGVHKGMRCATASSADTPHAVAIGTAALGILEVVPGITVRDVLAMGWPEGFDGNVRIGRSPPLSSDKAATHFPLLKESTGVPYSEMLFFDDCNWGDHCGKVMCEWTACPLDGPCACRTSCD